MSKWQPHSLPKEQLDPMCFCLQLCTSYFAENSFFFFFSIDISIHFIARELGFSQALHLVWLLCTCVMHMYNATCIMCKVTLTVIVTQEVRINGLWFQQWAASVTEARISPSIMMKDQSNMQTITLVPCITRSCSKHSLSNAGVKSDLNWDAAF